MGIRQFRWKCEPFKKNEIFYILFIKVLLSKIIELIHKLINMRMAVVYKMISLC